MGSAERFGHFEIARGADGRPIELPRSAEELVFLAFDVWISRLVELHVLKAGERLRPAEKRSAIENIKLAGEIYSSGLPRILSDGEDNDSVYYSTSLSDGEPLEDYIARRGALPSSTAFSLVFSLLEDLILVQKSPQLLAGIQLSGLQIAILEDTFLQLRILDYGLSSHHGSEDVQAAAQRLCHEICEIVFLMLTGKSYAGDDCDRIPVLTGLPTGLRAAIRSSLANPANAPTSLERMRDDVRDALNVMTRDLGSRSTRRHLVATDMMVPKSALRGILLHDVPLEKLLGGRLTLEENLEGRRYPFTILASDARTEVPLTVHLLPPRRIVSNEHYDAVPLQMWRFNPDKHPNILRSLSVWESPDLTFLTEERGPGFPLSRLIAERVYLNPSEVLILLRQIQKGITQAAECGVDKLDLHPSTMMLRLSGPLHAREMDKLLQKRLDAWPKFQVMLRPHVTMRNLYEPLLLEVGRDEESISPSEFKTWSFIALSAYLLSGEQQTKRQPRLPDSVPPPLTDYILESLTRCRQRTNAPTVDQFLSEFERRSTATEPDSSAGDVYVLPQRKSALREIVTVAPAETMESAGSVSDFDEDQPMPYLADTLPSTSDTLFRKPGLGPAKQFFKGHVAIWLWAVGVALLGILLMLWFRPRTADAKTGKTAELVAPHDGKSSTSAKSPDSREEVRKALVPTEEEKAVLKKHQSSRSTRMALDAPLLDRLRVENAKFKRPEISALGA